MFEFEQWKNSVVAKLEEKGVPIFSNSLVTAWNSNYSIEYTVMSLEAEFLCGHRPTKFDLAKRCGCFRCVRFFKPDQICWDDGIAECPYCGIDAVLPETEDYILTPGMLMELSIKQFADNPFVG